MYPPMYKMKKEEHRAGRLSTWLVLSREVKNSYEPMRFAGTWKQYSKKAMPQLARMTFQSASLRYLRWPYHANVMKMFEMVSSKIVRTIASGASWCRFCDAA